MRIGILAATLAVLLATPASAVTVDWVEIGDPGNAADPDTSTDTCGPSRNQRCGSVASPYRIGKYEVTNQQYAEFLNAKAVSDPLGLYHPSMGSDTSNGGIVRSGTDGSYGYTVKSGFGARPVVYVSFYDAIRFANWLSNGQGAGSTETGAYTLLGGTPIPSNGAAVTRDPNATVFLANESEWYKAAYYDPIGDGYFRFPAGTSVATACAAPAASPNRANCGSVVDALTDAGSYTGSASPNGTFDQGGNVYEWNEQLLFGVGRCVRGGSWVGAANALSAAFWSSVDPSVENDGIGFRVASLSAPDDDGDGIADDGDNCPHAPNPDQSDAGGVGLGSGPDGIGDVCQCGDVGGDGVVTLSDAAMLQRSLLQPPTAVQVRPALCDVNGSGTCSLADAVVIRRTLLNPPTATIQQLCAPARP